MTQPTGKGKLMEKHFNSTTEDWQIFLFLFLAFYNS